jgi:hypothetical protein
MPGPQLRAHGGRPGGVDGLVRVRVTTRQGQRRPAARRGNRPPAADLLSRRPATASAAPPARPVAGRTRRPRWAERGYCRPARTPGVRSLSWPFPRPTRPGPRRAPSHHHSSRRGEPCRHAAC